MNANDPFMMRMRVHFQLALDDLYAIIINIIIIIKSLPPPGSSTICILILAYLCVYVSSLGIWILCDGNLILASDILITPAHLIHAWHHDDHQDDHADDDDDVCARGAQRGWLPGRRIIRVDGSL